MYEPSLCCMCKNMPKHASMPWIFVYLLFILPSTSLSVLHFAPNSSGYHGSPFALSFSATLSVEWIHFSVYVHARIHATHTPHSSVVHSFSAQSVFTPKFFFLSQQLHPTHDIWHAQQLLFCYCYIQSFNFWSVTAFAL